MPKYTKSTPIHSHLTLQYTFICSVIPLTPLPHLSPPFLPPRHDKLPLFAVPYHTLHYHTLALNFYLPVATNYPPSTYITNTHFSPHAHLRYITWVNYHKCSNSEIKRGKYYNFSNCCSETSNKLLLIHFFVCDSLPCFCVIDKCPRPALMITVN